MDAAFSYNTSRSRYVSPLQAFFTIFTTLRANVILVIILPLSGDNPVSPCQFTPKGVKVREKSMSANMVPVKKCW